MPLGDYARVGVVHAAAFPECSAQTALASIRAIAADGFFRAIEITPVDDAKSAREIRQVLTDAGMLIDMDAGAGLYRNGLSLCSVNAESRGHAIDYARWTIAQAGEMQADRVTLVSGPDPGDRHRSEAMAALIDALLDLCGYARATGGVQLALKMADRAVDKRFLIGPTLEGVQVARTVRKQHPGFGLVLNLGHLPLLDEDPAEAVQQAAPVLSRVQIGNCVRRDRSHSRYGDSHPRIGIPGGEIGEPELAWFLRELLRVDYLARSRDRVVAFEVRPGPEEDSRDVLAHCKRALASAWARV
jgi:sugar phosphate isomerase/epimerase